MRHGKSIKEAVRGFRRKGFSLNQIFEETKVPKTTIRTWIYDIVLSQKHKEILRRRTQTALQEGRIKAQEINKQKRVKKESSLIAKGKKDINELNRRELFIAGVALYWAEGFKNKHEHRLGFCNSDPSMIKFYIAWLEKCLGINKDQITARLTLNYSYKNSVDKMQDFWAKTIGIPLSNFTKPFFQTSKWKKQYNTKNYNGVLRVHVKNSLDHLLKMKGWIEGLKMIK